MKYIKLFVILINIVIISNCYSQSGWFWQNPLPLGIDLYSFKYFNNNSAIATGGCGTIFKTTNNGLDWKIVRTDSSYSNTSLYFHDDNTGWVIGSKDNGNLNVFSGSRVMKTTDSGYNWEEKYFLYGSYMSSIEFTCLDTGYITVRNSNNGFIYKTVNKGISWSQISNLNNFACKTYFLNNTTGFVCGDLGISKTNDGGNTWQNKFSFSGFGGKLNSITFLNINTGIAVGLRYGYQSNYQIILKTTNSGENWTEIAGYGNGNLYDIKKSSTNELFACGSNLLLRSTDMGFNWTNIQLIENAIYKSIDFKGLNGITIGSNGNMLNTSNNGVNWINNFSSNRIGYGVNSIKFYNKLIGYAVTGNRVLKTTNGGNNWTIIIMNTNKNLYTLSVTDESIIYVAGGESSSPGSVLFKSTDGGLIWNTQNSQSLYGIRSMSFVNSFTGYCLSTGSVSKTTNGGINWVNISENYGFSIFFVDPNIGYIIAFTGGYKTTNGGNNWNSIPVAGEDIYFLNAETGFAAGYGMRISKTTNGGSSWTIQTQSSEGWRFYGIHFYNSQFGYAVGDYGAIARTTNGGNNWTYQSSLTNFQLKSVFMTDTNECYAAGLNNTILKTTTGGNIIGIQTINTKMLSKYNLSQNYPNPFNPQTKIKFDIPSNVKNQTSNVILVIYDQLGREVTTLVNEELKPGTYEADWDGSNFSSGVYFYKIISNEFTETRKMVLMK